MQHLYAIDLFKGVMQSPGHNTATVDINDSRKIHKALPHRNIGDVYTPHVIWMVYVQMSQEVRLLVFCGAWFRK